MTTRSTKPTRIKIKVRRGTVAAKRTRFNNFDWIDIKIVSPNPKKCATLRMSPMHRMHAKRQVEDVLNAGWISSEIDEFFDKVKLL